MAEEQQPKGYEGWAIVELMGHRQTAGLVRDAQQAGTTLLRIDTPGPDGPTVATQFYGGAAIYSLTPCDEAAARKMLEEIWQLPPTVKLALANAEARRSPALPFDGGPIDMDDNEYTGEPEF